MSDLDDRFQAAARAAAAGLAWEGVVLGAAARSVWAKTSYDEETRERRWLPLWQHLGDSGAVAGRLWDEWLTTSVRRMCAAAFGGAQAARRVATFLGGSHDVGKATPAFVLAAPADWSPLTAEMAGHGLVIPAGLSAEDRRRLPHGLAGAAVLRRWLVDTYGWSPDAADQLAVVVGGHHGIPQDAGDVRRVLTHPTSLGGPAWQAVQVEFLCRAARVSGLEEHLPQWTSIKIPQPVQVVLSGLVIMADWIASNVALFPHVPLDTQPGPDRERVRRALAELGLPTPWRPVPGDDAVDVRMHARFDLPDGAEARPVQRAAVDAASSMDLPGLLVVEAPMGEGKTEAALLAAEVLAARSRAGGCFVALPTQATTDAMLRRVLRWLSRLPDDAGHVAEAAHSVVLAHGRARLNETFRELQWSGRIDGVSQDEPDRSSVLPFVHGWTSGRKKGPLADFVVGTIDQLLFVSLKARHLALRHLGIARKVVIVDEVHAYDAYMSVYLERALQWLGAYGVPVVLLSATLPSERRRGLCAAYEQGLASHAPQSLVLGTSASDGSAYPSVTYSQGTSWRTVPTAASSRCSRVRLMVADGDVDSVRAILRDRLRDGGCALVVRNTVRAAQETYRALVDEYRDDVRLTHARYIGHHRISNDAGLLRDFGPPDEEGTERPRRAVVVGTQVVEQSLDIDFDVIVTDLAPVDLLLQRIGRVHRHDRPLGARPAPAAEPSCVVLGVPPDDAAPELDRGSVMVYGRHTLLCSAALVHRSIGTTGVWRLPDDIAALVEEAYGDECVMPPTWAAAGDAARVEQETRKAQREAAAGTFRLGPPAPSGEPILGWLHAGIGEADETSQGRAQVRDAPESFEVLILQEAPDGAVMVPEGDHGGAGREVPTTSVPPSDLAQVVAGCAVRLPPWCARGADGVALLDALQQTWFEPWQRSPLLDGQLVLPMTPTSAGSLRAERAGLEITYHRTTGLEVRRLDR